MRGQANLLALAVAVVLVTTTTGLGVVVADEALAAERHDATEQRVAVVLSERILTTTRRPGESVDRRRFQNRSTDALEALLPAVDGQEVHVRVELGNRTLIERGDARGGTTVRRIALVARENQTATSRLVELDRRQTVAVPADVQRVRLRVRPTNNTSVTAVRANERVVLYDSDGLSGSMVVSVDRLGPTTLRFETTENATGRVRLGYRRLETRAVTLEVTASV